MALARACSELCAGLVVDRAAGVAAPTVDRAQVDAEMAARCRHDDVARPQVQCSDHGAGEWRAALVDLHHGRIDAAGIGNRTAARALPVWERCDLEVWCATQQGLAALGRLQQGLQLRLGTV
nr:hypothetical protein [Hankyongella ginsenosidimutans]